MFISCWQGRMTDDAILALGKMVREHDISQHVTFTGLISGDLWKAALQDADAFVLPSRFEGLSIALLEAMYMGLPVIVTDRVGLWRQIREHRCGFVVPLDEEQIAGALDKMVADDKRSEMGQRGHDLIASNYTWDVIAQNLVTEIQDRLA